jgi:hypothetical protein
MRGIRGLLLFPFSLKLMIMLTCKVSLNNQWPFNQFKAQVIIIWDNQSTIICTIYAIWKGVRVRYMTNDLDTSLCML